MILFKPYGKAFSYEAALILSEGRRRERIAEEIIPEPLPQRSPWIRVSEKIVKIPKRREEKI